MRHKTLLTALLLTTLACTRYAQTDLYLGLSTPDHAAISDREFQQFLDEVVTPRFPDGYTVLTAEGRWRAPDARSTLSEPSRIITILRPRNDTTHQKLEEIRHEYKQRFDQQSVLRVDHPARPDF